MSCNLFECVYLGSYAYPYSKHVNFILAQRKIDNLYKALQLTLTFCDFDTIDFDFLWLLKIQQKSCGYHPVRRHSHRKWQSRGHRPNEQSWCLRATCSSWWEILHVRTLLRVSTKRWEGLPSRYRECKIFHWSGWSTFSPMLKHYPDIHSENHVDFSLTSKVNWSQKVNDTWNQPGQSVTGQCVILRYVLSVHSAGCVGNWLKCPGNQLSQ